MTPTDEFGGVRLYRGDCLDVLPSLTGVDAVITDPPYGIALTSHGTLFRGMKPIAGDGDQSVGLAVLEACGSRGWPVAAFSDPDLPWPFECRQRLVWDKGPAVGIGGDRATCWKFTWELLQVGKFKTVHGGRDEAVLRFPVTSKDFKDHPAAKPVSLMRYLVRKLTLPGGTVLDPFMGSGSTGVACLKEGRQFIGCELDPTHYATALKRLRHADGAGSLFDPKQLTLTDPTL